MSERTQAVFERLYRGDHLAFVNRIVRLENNPYIEINLGSGDQTRTGAIIYRVPLLENHNCIQEGDFVSINTTPEGVIKIVLSLNNLARLDEETRAIVSQAFDCYDHPCLQGPETKELKK
ncbi:MAG: hypothetical protein AAB546_01190 [Patescibacteria group bacterium]